MELCRASQNGDINMVKHLIKNGINLNEYDSWGFTALMYAVVYGRIEIVKELLNSGANANVNCGNSVLIEASMNNHIEIVRELIRAGANINYYNNKGNWTALMVASHLGHVDIAKELLNAGANINIRDCFDYDALALAKQHSRYKIIKILKEQIIKDLKFLPHDILHKIIMDYY